MINTLAWWLFIALLPLVYWLLPPRVRPVLLALASIAFLVALSPIDLLVMLGIALAVYAIAATPGAARLRGIYDRLPAAGRATIPVTIVLAYLAWFKYVTPITSALGFSPKIAAVAVPLGISYFSFKAISYALESARNMLPAHGFRDYMSWLFLMPTFSAGPIEPFDHYLDNRATAFDPAFVVEGGTRIVQGLVKKFVLGAIVTNACANLSSDDLTVFAHIGHPANVWAYLLLSVLSGYLDFSGYSDIAIGASRLFGLRIIENFNYPYLATNLGEFWRRWHISLVMWCRAYVFMPLVGLTRNPFLAILCTFLVIGFWHSSALLWVTWGLWHGVGQVIMQKWVRFAQKRKIKFFRTGFGTATGWSMTMAYVALGDAFVVMYLEGSYATAWRLIARAFGV